MPRRCGGLGDLLGGALATFVSWANANPVLTDQQRMGNLVAACRLIKKASALAYERRKRGTVASDVLEVLPEAFQQLFPEDQSL